MPLFAVKRADLVLDKVDQPEFKIQVLHVWLLVNGHGKGGFGC